MFVLGAVLILDPKYDCIN